MQRPDPQSASRLHCRPPDTHSPNSQRAPASQPLSVTHSKETSDAGLQRPKKQTSPSPQPRSSSHCRAPSRQAANSHRASSPQSPSPWHMR